MQRGFEGSDSGAFPIASNSEQPGSPRPPVTVKIQNYNKVVPPVATSQAAGSDGGEGTTNKVPRPGRPPSPLVSNAAPIVTSNPFSALARLACEDENTATNVVTSFNRKTGAGKRRRKRRKLQFIRLSRTGRGEGEEEFLPVVSVSEGARLTSSTAESGGSPPPRCSPVTLGDMPMEDPGVGLSFTYEVPRSVQDLLSTDRENTRGNESPLETFHIPHTQPIVPVVSTKRKRAMGDSNDHSIRRKLILRDESGKKTSLEGSLEIPSSTGSPALSPIVTERTPEEISKIPNLDGYRDTLDVSGFLPLGHTSVILAPSDTLENASEKEAPSVTSETGH